MAPDSFSIMLNPKRELCTLPAAKKNKKAVLFSDNALVLFVGIWFPNRIKFWASFCGNEV